MAQPHIRSFFDPATNAVSYLVADPATGEAAAIDPVLDYDSASGRVETRSADALLAAAKAEGWRVTMLLETHVHADHLTAAHYLKARTGAWIGIGAGVDAVLDAFAPDFGLDPAEARQCFDRLLKDGESIALGELSIAVIATPGHTPACVSYRIGDAVFVGDTLFMPDYGTARCDFPGGSARTLHGSIARLLALPPGTRLYLCHDYKAPGRGQFAWETSVADQRAANVHLAGKSADEFIAMRESRDATLSAPKLLLPALQVNLRAGRLPTPEHGQRSLRIPLGLPADYPAGAA